MTQSVPTTSIVISAQMVTELPSPVPGNTRPYATDVVILVRHDRYSPATFEVQT